MKPHPTPAHTLSTKPPDDDETPKRDLDRVIARFPSKRCSVLSPRYQQAIFQNRVRMVVSIHDRPLFIEVVKQERGHTIIHGYSERLKMRSTSGSEVKGVVSVQVIFCLREKTNSHRWFFNVLGPPPAQRLRHPRRRHNVRPNITLPPLKAFDINPNVGGACGEIMALIRRRPPLVAAQNFKYKMSNILDKPLEGVFGYITVLPCARSAYRYIAA